MQLRMLVVTAAASLALASSAGAAELVSFGFAGAGNIDEKSPYSGGNTRTDPRVSITSGLQIGTGFDVVGGNGGTPGNGAFRFSGVSDQVGEPVGLSEAIADREFVRFSVSGNFGLSLDLSGGSVVIENLLREGNSGRAPDSFALLSDILGFTAGNAIDSVVVNSGGVQSVKLDIPDSSAYENLSGSVEFRVYVYRSTSPTNIDSGGGGISLTANNNAGVALNGVLVAPIPEPVAAGAAGLLGLVALRRRRG